jgi:hypothetical protein
MHGLQKINTNTPPLPSNEKERKKNKEERVYGFKVCYSTKTFFITSTVKVCLSGTSSIGKVALAAYFHTAH